MDAQLVNHPLHSKHPLLKLHRLSGFTCNRCSTFGSGTRYCCDGCNLNLHLYCATCPPNVLSPLHPPHKLTLFRKLCDSCAKPIKGLFYRCDLCDFDLHPLCVSDYHAPKSKPSSQIDHLCHNHPLKLSRRDSQFACGACKAPCNTGKRYICEQCNFQIDLTCATCPLTLSSSLHPQHKLKLCWKRCDECGHDVEGAFYRCNDCDFDLHPLCHQKTIAGAGSSFWVPTKTVKEDKAEEEKGDPREAKDAVYFFMHPEHDLVEGEGKGWCEVCGEEVEGDGCYSCVDCGFYVHKDCSKIRPAVRDKAHGSHALHYQRLKVRECVVCRERCIKWRYSCSACDVHVHRGCLQGPPSASDALGGIRLFPSSSSEFPSSSSSSSSSASSSSSNDLDAKIYPR